MYYSGATDTVLMADFFTSQVFERTTTGAFVRVFSAPGGLGSTFAVTRGVDGDVYATSFSLNRVYRWTAAGVFVGFTPLSQLDGLIGIINIPVTASDFGDAPDPTYPTLLASNGARHSLSSSLRLGPTVDDEADGQPNSGATGDDIAGIDDEDGVSFVGTLIAGAFRGFVVNVAGGPGKLDAWIDFNADGDWNDAGERIANGAPVINGSNVLIYFVPADAVVGQTYARVRLSTAGVAAPTGAAPDGEVEDEIVSIAQPTLIINDTSGLEGDVGTSARSFTVTLSDELADSVFVDYATVDGSATTADGDYVAKSGTLEIPAGTKTASVSVTVKGDAKFETDETFRVVLSSPVGATIDDGSGQGTIRNDDVQPTVSFALASSSVAEGSGVQGVTVSLSNPSYLPVTVNLNVSGASTASSADYTGPSPATVTIAAGATSAVANVTFGEDTLDEDAETLILTLGSPGNAFPGSGTTFTFTITDNDLPPTVSFTASTQNLAEAAPSGSVTMQLSTLSGKNVTVPLTFAGSASFPGDYGRSGASISIPAGSLTGSITLTPVNDAAFESPNETVIVNAGSPTNATLATPSSQTVTIVDDDAMAVATLTLAPASATKPTLTQHCVTAAAKDVVNTVLPGIALAFTVTGVNPTTGTGTTNAAGTAQFCYTGVNGGSDSIKVSFMTVMATATVTWNKRATNLKVEAVPSVTVTQGGQVFIRVSPKATLKDTTSNTPIAGKTVSFFAGTTPMCTATTNTSGVATCQFSVLRTLAGVLSLGYTGKFAGDGTYQPSQGNGGILGLKLF